jgi:hypothetical protein
MSVPGFTAQTSLYRTSTSYRGLATGSDRLTGGVIASGGWTSTFASEVTRLNPWCGAVGGPCCRAPFQNVPAFGPLVSCQEGLGCDVTTNKCVSTCGGPGQVCCDGPETRALKWTADGKVQSPNSWNLREMCNQGACDRQTHRCFACGTQEGAPCCPPDAAQATARCVGDHLQCQFDPLGFSKSGTCRACGSMGKPNCHWGCDTGLGIRNGLCVICGGKGQLACDDGCDTGLRIRNGLCDTCGGNGQLACDDGCQRGLTASGGVCWQPQPPGGGGRVGGVSGSSGGSGSTQCGASGQNPCASGCNQGLILSGGKCVVPPPPATCALEGQACVADFVTGTHCCQTGGPLLCVFGHCKACVPHGEECKKGGSQICCSAKDGDTCMLDQFSGKDVCGIPG